MEGCRWFRSSLPFGPHVADTLTRKHLAKHLVPLKSPLPFGSHVAVTSETEARNNPEFVVSPLPFGSHVAVTADTDGGGTFGSLVSIAFRLSRRSHPRRKPLSSALREPSLHCISCLPSHSPSNFVSTGAIGSTKYTMRSRSSVADHT